MFKNSKTTFSVEIFLAKHLWNFKMFSNQELTFAWNLIFNLKILRNSRNVRFLFLFFKKTQEFTNHDMTFLSSPPANREHFTIQKHYRVARTVMARRCDCIVNNSRRNNPCPITQHCQRIIINSSQRRSKSTARLQIHRVAFSMMSWTRFPRWLWFPNNNYSSLWKPLRWRHQTRWWSFRRNVLRSSHQLR